MSMSPMEASLVEAGGACEQEAGEYPTVTLTGAAGVPSTLRTCVAYACFETIASCFIRISCFGAARAVARKGSCM